MSAIKRLLLLAVAAIFVSCSGGGGAGGSFLLLEFQAGGKANLARNSLLTFRFSEPVAVTQDFFERLSIERTPGTTGGTFARAIGDYMIVGEVVQFQPRYPELDDRSDAGLHPTSVYTVFCKSGPDALASDSGSALAEALELGFETGEHFDDPMPADPPRVVSVTAADAVAGTTIDLSRLAADPNDLALLDSADLLGGGRIIEPGAGGAPNYATQWQFDLGVSEPLDPATVNTKNIELWEIRHDALEGADTADPGHMGDLVAYRVPIEVRLMQRFLPGVGLDVRVRVTALQTLLDDARYRLVFSGRILGIDFREAFIGTNGLTGDDPEPGGFGYVTEFLVYDRPGINTTRTLEYAPFEDEISPEDGTTTFDPAFINRVPYDPASNPSCAVGVAPIFGDGSDGNLAVAGGAEVTLETGDTLNTASGNPFEVYDLDPDDHYPHTGMPPDGTRTVNGITPTEFQFLSLTVTGTLRIRGVNPARIRVSGLVQVSGTIDASGEDGLNGVQGAGPRVGGAGGPGGFTGGTSLAGLRACNIYGTRCTPFQGYLDLCQQAKAGFPFSMKGDGPGRGNNGGEAYQYYYKPNGLAAGTDHVSGTGGGGGGHAESGGTGDDNLNQGGSVGTPGPACDSTYGFNNSSVIGVRGVGGSFYGDRELSKDFVGGSGGGAGGSLHQPTYASASGSGGSGGGGGGWLEIISRGSIIVSGTIDVSGGNGGQGAVVNTYSFYPNYLQATGAGGGGSGGGISLISGDGVNVSGGDLDATGGFGGPPADPGNNLPCPACNGGGEGAKGFVFIMDPDGFVEGLAVPGPGEYDSFDTGVLTVRAFGTQRFGEIIATTQLFRVNGADPSYLDLNVADLFGTVATGQTVKVYMSSARADEFDPLLPDLSTESASFHVATIRYDAGGQVIDLVPGAMQLLHPGGVPSRESFLRVRAEFDYEQEVQAATGPYALLDRVVVRVWLNG